MSVPFVFFVFFDIFFVQLIQRPRKRRHRLVEESLVSPLFSRAPTHQGSCLPINPSGGECPPESALSSGSSYVARP